MLEAIGYVLFGATAATVGVIVGLAWFGTARQRRFVAELERQREERRRRFYGKREQVDAARELGAVDANGANLTRAQRRQQARERRRKPP